MNQKEQLEALSDIRNIMNRSSRFISLSGLSGVFAGVAALVGAYFAYQAIEEFTYGSAEYNRSIEIQLFLIGFVVLVVALAGSVFFTYRHSRKRNLPFWDKTTRSLLSNLFIPLITGGFFILAILFKHPKAFLLIAPATLIFYGLGLINASKYTYSDIRFLGICEVVLGIIALFFSGYDLYFWAFGFGVLHILYGSIMYFKYEKSGK